MERDEEMEREIRADYLERLQEMSYLARLARDRADLLACLRECHRELVHQYNVAYDEADQKGNPIAIGQAKLIDKARSLLARLEKGERP